MDDTHNAQQIQHHQPEPTKDAAATPKPIESNLVRLDQQFAKSIQFHSKVMDVLVAYGACKKNQNHTSTAPVLDGCMEFSSSFKGERKCEACGCHRSFHERIILMRDQNGTISCASQMVLPEMGPFSGNRKDELPYLSSGAANSTSSSAAAAAAAMGSIANIASASGSNKRRKLDEFVSDDAYADLLAASSGAIILNSSAQQPMPLQSLEVIDGELKSSSSGWLCEADKEKLLGYHGGKTKQQHHHHGELGYGGGGAATPAAPPEKLASFFERLQKEHPESPLKLEFVDGSWRVLCGVCARYLRADKKGETLHNVQKQHFVTPKHISNLKAKLEAPDEMEFWLKRMAKLREKRAQQRAQPRFITAG